MSLVSPRAFPPITRERILVIGAGVAGLTTALCARRQGYDVVVVADRFAPHITSVVAGALWEWPPAVCGQHRDQVSLERSKHWAAMSYQVFEELATDPGTGVHIRPAVFYFRASVQDDSHEHHKMTELRDHVRGFRHDSDLILEYGIDPRADVKDAYCHLAPMIDTDQYMAWLLAEVRRAECQVIPARLRGVLAEQEDDLCRRYGAAAIVNCSGLGSVELAAEDMVPLRGAVVHVHNDGRRMPRITAAHCLAFDETLAGQNMIFIVPRGRDRLVLGGLVEPGEWRTDLTLENYAPIRQMVRRCQDFLPSLRELTLVDPAPVRVGLRPYRQRNVRLEREPGTRIVHNLGHGGSGFTFSWGCATEVVSLVGNMLA